MNRINGSNRILIAVLAMLLISPAWCSLIEVDIYNDGTNSGYRLSGSSLIWLDIGQTQNYSVNQVLGMTRAGGIYQGWRLPTELEVRKFWEATIGNNYTWSWYGQPDYYLNEPIGSDVLNYWYLLADIMGTTSSGIYNDSGIAWFSSIGLYESDNGQLVTSHFATYQMYKGYVEGFVSPVQSHERTCVLGDTACTPQDYWNDPLSNLSTMLVKEERIAVPEPLFVSLFGALLLFMFLPKRSNNVD